MSSVLIQTPPALIQAETAADAALVERLVLAAFGPGRFAKTAERLRETASLTAGFTAWDGAVLIGSVRLWAVQIDEQPALFLGPIAVATGRRSGGLGAQLVQACLDFADTAGLGVVLVGDLAYFGRFGFGPAAGVRLPGPVEQARVLWRGETPAPSGPVRA